MPTKATPAVGLMPLLAPEERHETATLHNSAKLPIDGDDAYLVSILELGQVAGKGEDILGDSIGLGAATGVELDGDRLGASVRGGDAAQLDCGSVGVVILVLELESPAQLVAEE